jgi:hypothetical protein
MRKLGRFKGHYRVKRNENPAREKKKGTGTFIMAVFFMGRDR